MHIFHDEPITAPRIVRRVPVLAPAVTTGTPFVSPARTVKQTQPSYVQTGQNPAFVPQDSGFVRNRARVARGDLPIPFTALNWRPSHRSNHPRHAGFPKTDASARDCRLREDLAEWLFVCIEAQLHPGSLEPRGERDGGDASALERPVCRESPGSSHRYRNRTGPRAPLV